MAAWKLPLVVAAIAVPVAAAFLAGGPAVGVAVGALVAVGIVLVAVTQRPRLGLGHSPTGTARRLLVVVSQPVEDPVAIAEIAAAARGAAGSAPAAVMVLAPARIGFLDRWASDVEGARRAAQHNLVITVASLAKVGVAAEARVGDEDLVQAVEDALGSFDATEVILVTGEERADPHAARGAEELRSRLRTPFRRLVADSAAG